MHFERRILCILNGECLSKCIELLFTEKTKQKKTVCLPYLKCSDPLPETHLFFIWPNLIDKETITIVCSNFLLNWTGSYNPHKPSVLFVGHRLTVQTQIRCRKTWRLIRLSTVCSQKVLLDFE